MAKKCFRDIHVIETVPPSCINRDDTGSPKTAIYGGAMRARVSSQCWKKAMRASFADMLPQEEIGKRTKMLHALLADAIRARNPQLKAISRGEDNVAHINDDKCISCGACVYQCPFGAISDKSYILDAINMLRGSEDNKNYKVYAIVAPSISSQFRYAKLGQVLTALKKLGFYSVVEVALGADMVAYSEAQELAEKGVLTSSCCPAFVAYIEKAFPKLKDKISHNLSPMAELARYMKKTDPDCKIAREIQ